MDPRRGGRSRGRGSDESGGNESRGRARGPTGIFPMGEPQAPSRRGRGRGDMPEERRSPSPNEEDAGAGAEGGGQGGEAEREKRPPRNEDVNTRPAHVQSKQGSFGPRIRLLTNYFEMIANREFFMYQHHVTFVPEEDHTDLKKKLLAVHRDTLGGYIFDGHLLFTPAPIVPRGEIKELVSQHPTTNEIINLKIEMTKELKSDDPTCIQFYNIVVRKCMEALRLNLIQRSYFDSDAAIPIPAWKLTLWPGFSTSMRTHENGILFCVEATHKVLRDETAADIIQGIKRNFDIATPQGKDIVERELVGRYVMTIYNRRIYRIDQINWDLTPLNSFDRGEQGQITYKEYFMRYNQQTVQSGPPLLVSFRTKQDLRRGLMNDIHLMPEHCKMTGLTDNQRADFRLMKALNDHLHIIPSKRVEKTEGLMQKIQANDRIREDLARWAVEFNPNLIKLDGRDLGREEIEFFAGKKERVSENADWNNAFRNQKLLKVVPMKKWAIIVPGRDRRTLEGFVQTMNRVSRPIGFDMAEPLILEINHPNPDGYRREIESVVARAQGNIDMIMVVLLNNSLQNYARIKKACCVDYGIPSQCIVVKTLAKPGMSVATKVVVQMSAKLGGEPWTVPLPLKGLMVVGFDVHHGPLASGRRSSWGAIVASLSPTLGNFHSKVSRQAQGIELSTAMTENFKSCLEAYKKVNQTLPLRIAFYRDGVGEGQLEVVFNVEVAGLKTAIGEVYRKYNQELPKFLFVVVSKRIRTKFFLNKGQGVIDNPPFGTVVDDVVTLPTRYDFFIVSQVARQGTVSPTSYNIIHDTFGLDADKIQRLTYKLCHLYYNWSGPVSVPAVCQYAHKLAFLTGTAIERESNVRLANLLYYL